jgi:serine/threonine protein kinase/Tfp pilus assembly protein PilF
MLRTALGETLEFCDEELTVAPKPGGTESRFEHYELVRREDGTPFELGRGAMGITFKAIDTNLRFAVALKVVKARYLDNEIMRQRFVSEARAAASLRHPNVASVFHLGKTGEDYFYAMEFVEGEPLDRVLAYRGPLEVELALDIVEQVAAALSAAYQQNIVHRDVKPSNLMVTFGEGGRVTVKVIDFGLARPIRVPASEPRLSEAGMFIGTPQFASPEQCSGKEADIRSDLYSLGVTLWAMLTGKVPFDGSTLELMQKHQHEAPPLERLEHIPKPVVSLIESLLEKDRAKRPQTPYELQTMVWEVRETSGIRRPLDLVRNLKRVGLRRTYPWSRKRSLLIVISLAVGITMACFYLNYENALTRIDAKSVAVLPFDNLDDEKQNEYFSDGLTTEVIFQLSKIADLRVISRNSVLRYKTVPSTPLRQIGKELEVATILEGSVQRAENRVKIVTILYDARTNRRLWGESYDRDLKDVFAIQADVAENIAAALDAKLSSDERAGIQKKPTENLTAYDLYLRGLAWYELLHEDDNERAIAFFRQALEEDPKFALGYAALANAYVERVKRYHGEALWLDSAIDLCKRAIDLDPKQVRGYTALARALQWRNLGDQAIEPIRKALELAPNDEEANLVAANQFGFTDRYVEQYALLRKCHALNPNDPFEPHALAAICAAVRENSLAEKWMERAINLDQDPERHRMMECERMILRRNYVGALVGLRDLSPDLSTYGSKVNDLVIACSAYLRDWPKVLQLAGDDLAKRHEDKWDLFHMALGLRALNQETEARTKAERVLALALQELAINENHDWSRYLAAVASRFLNRNDEAYQNLRLSFPGVLDALPLQRDDPSLGPFVSDPEFQLIVADFEKKNEIRRARIREIEKRF